MKLPMPLVASLAVLAAVPLASPALAGVTDPAPQCAAAVGAPAIAEVKTEESRVEAHGIWESSGSAAGVVLEYRIDSDRLISEAQPGASGTWIFDLTLPDEYGCGPHYLRVNVFPYVQEGTRQIHCLSRVKYARQTFQISCDPIAALLDCQWECTGGDQPHCTGTCTGTARRGKPHYMPSWGVNGEGWQSTGEPGEGPFTQAVSCKPGERISFKVQDHGGRGRWSNMAEIGCGTTQ